jgi:hypothetical protein
VVRIERVFAAQQPEADLKAGDLVLAIELRTRTDDRAVLQPIDGVRALRDWFNNREIGSYDGARWRCWVARGDDVRAVELVARRLLW